VSGMTPAKLTRILSRARVPVVRAGTYIYGPDPYYRTPLSTYDPQHDLMHLMDDEVEACLHEHGHTFNVKCLRPEHQQLLREWWHKPNRIWWWGEKGREPMFPGPEALCEVFADVYSWAAQSRHPKYYRFKKLLRIAYKEAGLGT